MDTKPITDFLIASVTTSFVGVFFMMMSPFSEMVEIIGNTIFVVGTILMFWAVCSA